MDPYCFHCQDWHVVNINCYICKCCGVIGHLWLRGCPEDPGPGDVHVQVSDSSTIHAMEKRALSLKSEYFRSYLIRFHDQNMELQEENERTVELNSEFVSSEAWAVIKVYIESGELALQDEVCFACIYHRDDT